MMRAFILRRAALLEGDDVGSVILGEAGSPDTVRLRGLLLRAQRTRGLGRLYRRLLLRFLSQLGALFVLTAICFYISILAWSRVSCAPRAISARIGSAPTPFMQRSIPTAS